MKRMPAIFRQSRPGQMLLEVIIAMGVLVLFATGIMTLVLSAYDGRGRAQDRIVASYAATEGLEAARSLAWNSFDTLKDGIYGFDENGKFVDGSTLRPAQGLTSVTGTLQDGFSQKIIVSSASDDDVHETKRVESTVSWAPLEGRNNAKVTLETYLTSWQRPRWLTDLHSDFEKGGINGMSIIDDDDGAVSLQTNGNFLQPEVFAQIPVQSRITDLHVDPVSDLLYVLTEENPVGPELLVYDTSNVSSGSGALTLVAEAELIKDGITFAFTHAYAYILTGHSDQEVVVLRLADNTIVNAWNIEGEAAPRDIAIDEASGRAYVTLSTAEERIPQVIARRESEESKSLRRLSLFLQKLTKGVLWIAKRMPGVGRVFAQGAPTCNGQTATIYVSGGFIVGGPDNGNPYIAGVTTLRGNNTTGGTDVIVGTSGNDIIQGRNGPDIICGGAGNDNIDGGNQNDVIFGEDGADTITGGGQDDTICGDAGNDTLSGNNNNDSIAGGDGTDSIDGGNGTDVCREGESNTNCEDTTSAIDACGVTAADSTPPTITNVTSTTANGSYTVGASINITFTFSEAVTTTGTINLTLDSGGTCTFSGVTNSSTASCTYAVGSEQNSADLTVSNVSGTIKDQAGNSMVNFVPTTNLAANNNIVVDTVAPATPSATPTGGTYSTAQSLTLASAGSSAIYYTTNGTTPTTSSTLYTSAISVAASTTLKALSVDLAGNQSAVMTEIYSINTDTTPPTIATLSPADDATGVSFNPSLIITFSEAVTAVSGNVTIKKSSDNSIVEAIAVRSGQLSGSGTSTITLSTSVTLSSLTAYYVQIDASAFDDLAGNGFAGISDTTTWNFTTASSDTTNPSISTLSPADNATEAVNSTDLVITFDESVNVETGNITVKRASDGLTVETIDVTSANVTGDGTSTITVDISDLALGTAFYINIDATAFDDLVGNSFAGINDTTTWNFTTAETEVEERVEKKTRAERIREVARKMYVLDVSNPEATDSQAQVTNVNVGDFGEEIEVFGGYVYLATSDVDAELRIINAETLTIERCDLPDKQLVRDMSIRGNSLYITRAEGPEEEFVVYDIGSSKPGDCASLLAHKVRGIQLSDEARSLTMLPREDTAFVLGDFMESAVQIIDLAAKEYGQKAPVTFLQGFNGICDAIETVGSYLYAGCRTKEGKEVLTVISGEHGSEDHFQRGTFTAPPFDSGSSATAWKRIAWRKSEESLIAFRVRMAATKEGLSNAPWVGADGRIATSFSENSGESIILPKNASGTRWIQWKAYFENTEDAAPALEDVILTFDQPS